jgi:hypothetical protein
LGEFPEKHPAGAKAQPLLSGICGPTEVVPLLQNLAKSSFSAACKAEILNGRHSARLKLCPDTSSAPIQFAKEPTYGEKSK